MPEWVEILEAARIGMGWTDERLAERSGASLQQLRKLKEGSVEPALLRRLAGILHLSGEALLSLAGPAERRPALSTPRTLRSLEVAAGRGYLLWDSASRLAALIDVGEECPAAVRLLESEFLTPRYLLFTEPDRAPEPAWARLLEARSAPALRPEAEEREGAFSLGTLRMEGHRAAGAAEGGRLLYLVHGMEAPVAFVGRCLLPPGAEALKKDARAYRRWLEGIRSDIFTLSDRTLLCPARGPITSVGWEKAHNPFFPEFEHFSPFASLTEENGRP